MRPACGASPARGCSRLSAAPAARRSLDRAGRCAAAPRPRAAGRCRHRARAAHGLAGVLGRGRARRRRRRGRTRAARHGSVPRSRACRRPRGRGVADGLDSTGTCALPVPKSRWRCAASATCRARRASCRRACSTPGDRFAYRLQATGVADADDDKSFRPDGSYVAVVLGNWIAARRLHRSLVGAGLGGEPDLRQQRAPDSVDHDRAQLFGCGRPSVARLDRPVALRGDDGPARRATARTRRTRSFFGARVTWKPHPTHRDRHLAQRAMVRRWAALRRRARSGICSSATTTTSRSRSSRATSWPASTCAGRCRGVPVAALRAGDRRGRGGLPAEQVPRARSAPRSGADSATGPGARTSSTPTRPASFYESEPKFGCAYRNVIYFDGYQYRDRSIGHAIDGDSEQIAAGLMLVNGDGSSWELAVQSARRQPREREPRALRGRPWRLDIRSADLYHRRALLGGELEPRDRLRGTRAAATGRERRRRAGIRRSGGGISIEADGIDSAWALAAVLRAGAGLAVGGPGDQRRAQAPTLTNEQLEILRSLPPDQRDALIERAGHGRTAPGRATGSCSSRKPSLRGTERAAHATRRIVGDPRFRAEDTLLLLLEVREFEDPEPVVPRARAARRRRQRRRSPSGAPDAATRSASSAHPRNQKLEAAARTHPGTQSIPARQLGRLEVGGARADPVRRPDRRAGGATPVGRAGARGFHGRHRPPAARTHRG